MKDNKNSESLHDAWLALIAVIKALYNTMPVLMIVFTYLIFKLIEEIDNNLNFQMWVLTVVIFVSSIVIYIKSKNYGESVLSLSAGLFTIYTVKWTTSLFISFICVWVSFTLVVLLLSTIKLSSQIESIYMEATFSLGKYKDTKEGIKQLEEISNNLKNSMLGPVEKAKVIRQFCFRKIELDKMSTGLKWVSIFWTLTRIDYLTLSDFVCIVLKNASVLSTYITADKLFDFIYNGIKDSTATPVEYMDMFKKTRYLLIQTKNVVLYFYTLSEYFKSGLSPEDAMTFISEKVII